jgi:molybdopterin-containing oxidoreductase family membrane subunit
MRPRVESYRQRLEHTVLNPLVRTNTGYYAFVLFLLAVVAWGLYAYVTQLRYGLLATGMRDVVMWGLYLVNFVFFIGISHAGTLISAILRVSHAGWRTPVTRMAELITVVALSVGALFPIIDLGRPDRVLNLLWFGRFQSPIIWDVVSITSYLVGSITYLYLPLIPDFALMRDRLGRDASAFKSKVYTFLAVGWKNRPEQRQRMGKAIGIMAITIIPVAVSVHTVVSFIFSMTLRPGWSSTIFGVYFVIGAIFSGIATILIVMAIFRKLYHLEEYITEKHFRNLGYLLLTTLLFYLYLTFSEYLTIGYQVRVEDKSLLETLMLGKNAPWFWSFWVLGIVIPAFLLIFRRLGRTIPRLVTAAVLINVAMWLKRFFIVIPSIQVPLMPFEFGAYSPTWVEWSITAAAFAGFMLVFAIAAKLIPLISIWEVAEEAETVASPQPGETAERGLPLPREGIRETR